MEERITRLETHVEMIRNDLHEIKSVIIGNGKPGFIVRIDRLEQDAEKRKWGLRAAGAALMGVIGKMLLS